MAASATRAFLFDLMLEAQQTLVLDGAMGTELFAKGLTTGDAPERLNLTSPELVSAVHHSYLAAGSDIVLTNTFGGNHFRLRLHGLHDQVHEINKAAAAIASEACFEHNGAVAGSIGPLGELLEPYGSISIPDAIDAFEEQADGLASGGRSYYAQASVDLFWIETMSSLEEAEAAITACRSVSDLPIAVTMSFDTNKHTMMGVSPADAAVALTKAGAAAVGLNCGNNLDDNETAIRQMQQAVPDAVLIAKANAGIPEWAGADLTYSGTPAVMASFAVKLRDIGVRLIGGCCGTTPTHIAAMRAVL
jgi:methionine synthase I (cobalamin-dependent)